MSWVTSGPAFQARQAELQKRYPRSRLLAVRDRSGPSVAKRAPTTADLLNAAAEVIEAQAEVIEERYR